MQAAASDQTSRSGPWTTALLVAAWAVPLLLVKNWGNSYTEPKIFAVFMIGLCSATAVARRAAAAAVETNLWLLCMMGVLACRLASLVHTNNVGLHLQAIGLTVSAIAIGHYIHGAGLRPRALAGLATVPVAVILVGALAMIVFRRAIFSDYSPFGSTVGLKNSVSVFLAQSLPLLLVLLLPQDTAPRRATRVVKSALVVLLVALVCWVVFANRTRSAWWMLVVYAVGMVVAWIRSGDRRWAHLSLAFMAAAAIGMGLLALVPNRLAWTSVTPYSDSLSRMASLEGSSGRDKLWTVGLEMLRQHPLLGVGTGNYPVVWRDYIRDTHVDPAAFAFIRPDLPLFNDYLQVAVEDGLVAAVLFIVAMVVLPVRTFFRLTARGASSDLAPAVLCLAGLGLVVDAAFDYPFSRPETLLLFVLCHFAASKSVEGRVRVLPQKGRAAMVGFLAAGIFLGGVALRMAAGLTVRALADDKPAALSWALTLWPWDCQWRSSQAKRLLAAGERDVATRYAALRRAAWPQDPESSLIDALVLEDRGDFAGAIDAYRTAVVKVRGGRCHDDGFREYLRMSHRPDLPPGLTLLTEEERRACEHPRKP